MVDIDPHPTPVQFGKWEVVGVEPLPTSVKSGSREVMVFEPQYPKVGHPT